MYALMIPGAIVTDLTRYGTGREIIKDGWISKTGLKDGWYVGPTIKYAHKWQKPEKAESAAIIVSGFVPKVVGKLVVVEVVRLGKGRWKRATESRSSVPTPTSGPAGPCVTPSARTDASSSGS